MASQDAPRSGLGLACTRVPHARLARDHVSHSNAIRSRRDQGSDSGAPSHPIRDHEVVVISMRECFIPRPGYLFCSVDFDTFELRTWAQVCLWSVGQSRLATVLNAGGDPHVELGASMAGLSKEEGYKRAKDPEFKKTYRQPAKAGNFGFPGGMGGRRFRVAARKQGIFLSEQECYALRDAWLRQWPEASLYFAWINGQCRRPAMPEALESQSYVPQLTHYVSKRARGKVPYTAACNSYFQGLAADAAKAAGWALTKEMYSR